MAGKYSGTMISIVGWNDMEHLSCLGENWTWEVWTLLISLFVVGPTVRFENPLVWTSIIINELD